MAMAVTTRQGKRGPSYRVTVDFPRDPLTGARRQRSETFRTKKEALTREREWLTEIERGTAVDATKMTVGEYLPQWLATMGAETRGSTWERHERDVRLHLIPDLGSIRLSALTPLRVQAHINAKLERLSPGSVRRMVAVLSGAMHHVVTLGMIARNPCAGLKIPRASEKEMRVWNEEQVRTFLAATRADSLAALWRLAVLVGMRKGELLALHWEDIDLDRATIVVRRTLTCDKERNPIVGPPKTKAGKRTITIPATCVAALRAHQDAQRFQQTAYRDGWQGKNLVFPSIDGDYMYSCTPNMRLATIIKTANLPSLRFHDLRHTAATLMLLQGVSPRVVQERLGHSSLAMTLGLYSHVMLTMQEEAAERMDRMFGA
jgi:integrase